MNRTPTTLLAVPFLAIPLLSAGVSPAVEVFPVVHNQPLSLRVLDGKDGTPQPHVHILLLAGYRPRDLALEMWHQEVVTDDAGTAELSSSMRNLPLLRVEVLKNQICAPKSDVSSLSVEQIRGRGMNTVNRCGAATSIGQPGVLTIFVKAKKGVVLPLPIAGTPSAAPIPLTPALTTAGLAAPVPAPTDDPPDPDSDPMCRPQ